MCSNATGTSRDTEVPHSSRMDLGATARRLPASTWLWLKENSICEMRHTQVSAFTETTISDLYMWLRYKSGHTFLYLNLLLSSLCFRKQLNSDLPQIDQYLTSNATKLARTSFSKAACSTASNTEKEVSPAFRSMLRIHVTGVLLTSLSRTSRASSESDCIPRKRLVLFSAGTSRRQGSEKTTRVRSSEHVQRRKTHSNECGENNAEIKLASKTGNEVVLP